MMEKRQSKSPLPKSPLPRSPVLYGRYKSKCAWSFFRFLDFRQSRSDKLIAAGRPKDSSVVVCNDLKNAGNPCKRKKNEPASLDKECQDVADETNPATDELQVKKGDNAEHTGHVLKRHRKSKKTFWRPCGVPFNGCDGTSMVHASQYSHKRLVKKSPDKTVSTKAECDDDSNLQVEKCITGKLESQQQSKDLMDALGILSANKELFLKLLHDPNSILVKHIEDLKNSHVGKQKLESSYDHINTLRECKEPQSVSLGDEVNGTSVESYSSYPLHSSQIEYPRENTSNLFLQRKDPTELFTNGNSNFCTNTMQNARDKQYFVHRSDFLDTHSDYHRVNKFRWKAMTETTNNNQLQIPCIDGILPESNFCTAKYHGGFGSSPRETAYMIKNDIFGVCVENESMDCSPMDLPLFPQTTIFRGDGCGSDSTNTQTMEYSCSFEDIAEQPSPVSVLEQHFQEDVASPASTISQLELQVQSLKLGTEEHFSATPLLSPPKPMIAPITCLDEDVSDYEYARALLESCRFSWHELFVKYQSSDHQLLDELFLFDEIKGLDSFSDRRIVVDYLNEVLLETYQNELRKPKFISFSQKKKLIEEVMKYVDSSLFLQLSSQTLNELVEKDVAKSISWMDIGIELEDIVFEIVEEFLADLIGETV